MELYRRNGDNNGVVHNGNTQVVNNNTLHERLLSVAETDEDKSNDEESPAANSEDNVRPPCQTGFFAWFHREWSRSASAFSIHQNIDSEQDKRRFRGSEREDRLVLDVERMLAPQPLGWILLLKTVLFVWSLYTFFYSLANSPSNAPLAFFWAYLTRWGLTFSVLYLTCSWWIACVVWNLRRGGERGAMLASAAACDEAVHRLLVVSTTEASCPPRPTRLAQITWFLGAMAYPLEVLIVVFFWSFDYKPSDTVQYQMVMTHGGIALMVFIDYVLVNQLPLRLRHFPAFAVFGVLYILWLLIFDLLPMSNPYNVDNDDDAIYSVVQWRSAPCTTTLFALASIFGLAPALFATCWWVSNYAAPALNEALWSTLSFSDNGNGNGNDRPDDNIYEYHHQRRGRKSRDGNAFLFPMLPSGAASDLSSSSSVLVLD